MDLFFLQIDTTAITHTAPQTQNLWETLERGGVLMIPLGILFLALFISFLKGLSPSEEEQKLMITSCALSAIIL